MMVDNGHILIQEIATFKVQTSASSFVVRSIIRFGMYSVVEPNESPLL
jgi:hypothetical protein